MQSTLSVIPSEQEKILRKNLLQLIAKKKKTLILATSRYEELKIELDKIQEEYTMRIGRLYIKDNLLDLEIIRHKKINELLACGLTYDEAILEIEGNSKEELHKLEEEQEKAEAKYSVWEEASRAVKEEKETIRNVWKKLVQRFHPDLATSKEERKDREDVMKKINKAYADDDYNTLKTMEEKELLVADIAEVTMAHLEQTYVDLENALIRTRRNYQEIKASEWFSWKKKTQQEKEKLFAVLEKEMLDDIVRKELVLHNLKKKQNRV